MQGDGISASNADVVQTESDYRSASGDLEFVRTYRNITGRFTSIATTGLADNTTPNSVMQPCITGTVVNINPGPGAPSTITKCFPVLADGTQTYVLHPPNGRLIFFSGPPSAITQSADINERLTQVTNNGVVQWYLTHPDNSTDVFNAQGSLLTSTKVTGRQTTYTYTNGSLATIQDAFGRTLSFSYGSNGVLNQVITPNGETYTYGVNGNGSLASVTFPDLKVRTYLYNEVENINGGSSCAGSAPVFPFALTGIIDENGSRFISLTYDCLLHATGSNRPGGVYQYSVRPSNPASITDPLGTIRTQSFTYILSSYQLTSTSQPSGAGSAAATSSSTYDANGNVATKKDFDGNLTCYASDLTRNIETARLEGLASGGSCPASLSTYVPKAGTVQRLIQMQWHPTWRLKVLEAAPLKLTTWVFNGQPDPTNGNATASCAPSTALLPNGSPIAVLCKKVEQATTDTTGAAGFSPTATGSPRVWTYTYNQYGQKLTATGPRGNLATSDPNYAPDATTCVYYANTVAGSYTMGDLQSVTDAAGHVTTYPLYDGNGRVLESIDPNGTTMTLTYSPRGWLMSRTVTPPGGAASQLTSYGYDGVGQLLTVTQPDGTQITYTYDAAHRLTNVTDSAGDSINYTLDAMGNRATEQAKDPAGHLARQITRVYDALNRLQTITGASQ